MTKGVRDSLINRSALLTDLYTISGLVGIGLVGGLLADHLGLPMPFLLGSLLASASFTLFFANPRGITLTYPEPMRRIFVAMIGVMIGSSFSPLIMAQLPALWVSLVAVVPFVLLCHGAGYFIFRLIGKYDSKTAFYSAMPGGLIESVLLGEKAGCDQRILTAQQFIRIVLVVVSVPILFSLYLGEAVGSAAGMSFAGEVYDLWDIAMIVIIALTGLKLGLALRLPAAQMIGPLILSAIIHGSGLHHVDSPFWLLNLAQIVVGCGLGLKFNNIKPALLLRAFGLCIIAVTTMLGIGWIFASALMHLGPMAKDSLFVSFAPGGVSEMGLIALSLNASPVLVATHHLARIVVTILSTSLIIRLFPRLNRP